MANKFPKNLFVTRGEDADGCLVPGETLNDHAIVGERVRVAEYELKRVVEITTDAKISTEVGE